MVPMHAPELAVKELERASRLPGIKGMYLATNVNGEELDEKKFRWMLNDNAMAYEKTGEGIRKFAADVVKLEKFVASKL